MTDDCFRCKILPFLFGSFGCSDYRIFLIKFWINDALSFVVGNYTSTIGSLNPRPYPTPCSYNRDTI